MESPKEIYYAAMVELGGGNYRGIQRGDASIGLEPLVLFDDASAPKAERSTMALKPEDVSADRVRREIAAKREAYATFAQIPEQVFCGAAQ